jgi:hypothetical protein
MKRIVQNVLVWVAEHRISGRLQDLALDTEADIQDTTNAESGSWTEGIVGLFKTMLAFAGFVEFAEPEPAADDSFEAAQFSDLQARTTVPAGMCKPATGLAPAPGDRFWLTVGQHASLVAGGKVGEVFPMRVKLSSGELMRGEVLEFAAGPVTSHESDAHEFGAIAEGEILVLYVSIQKTDPDDPGTLDLVIESDADGTFGTPTTRFTVPQATGAAFYYATLAGPITDDNFRVNATQADATDFSYVVALAKVTAS